MKYEKKPGSKTSKGGKEAKLAKIKKPNPSDLCVKEIFTPGCLGHGVLASNKFEFIVHDYLVDSSGRSKGGESVNPLIQVGLNASKKIVYSIRPESCKSFFQVSIPPGMNGGYFGINLGRIATRPAPEDYMVNEYPAIVTFIGLIGTAPFIDQASLSISKTTNNSYSVLVTGYFTENFSFKEIKVVCKYPQRNFLPQFDYYSLQPGSGPVTLPRPILSVCYAIFGYESSTPVDLGPIIKIM